MSNNGFKCIYLVCVDYNNDVNHVIGRNPSLKKARKLASNARSKWPERDIYISVEKILSNPVIVTAELEQSYPEQPSETSPDTSDTSSKDETCICGGMMGQCVGNLSCRCNALARCKNPDLSRDNPFDTNLSWGLDNSTSYSPEEPEGPETDEEEYEDEEYEEYEDEEYEDEGGDYEDDEEYEDEDYEDESSDEE